MDEFSGRLAFVTGGASGIGFAIGAELAKRGMKVALADLDADALQGACSRLPGSIGIALNTASPERWGDALDNAEAAFGPLAVLVANAGVAGSQLSIAETPIAAWEWTRSVNLDGTFLSFHFGVPRLLRTGLPAHIIATASLAALLVWPENGAYSATKAAVTSLCETVRCELAGTKVGISVLLPSLVNTQILERNRMRAPTGVSTGKRNLELESAMRAGLAPETVAQIAADAIGTDRFWLFTHPELRGLVEARSSEIESALLASARAILDEPD